MKNYRPAAVEIYIWPRVCYNADMDIKAYGKINLTLDVLYRRPDGYHQLRGVMCAVDVYDAVHMERSEGVSVIFDEEVPPQNTAIMAARAFFEKTGRGADIYIQKGIPSKAGMGGASADAAGVLRGMNRLYGGPLSESKLYSIGLSIGADVPFCLMGGCAVAEGIGEVLTPLPAPELNLLIIKGNEGVNTGALFKELRLPIERRPDTDGAIAAIMRGDITGLIPLCENALEIPAIGLSPEIAQNKKRLQTLGAHAFMTGSGAAVVGIFKTVEQAAEAQKSFRDLPFARVCSTGGFVI